MTTANSFGARAPLKTAGATFEIFRLDALERRGLPVARLPYSLRILLENLLRREDGRTVAPAEIERLARWDPNKTPDDEIAFMPARVLMRSEEHTSELQSQSNLVCRLLLEKKKTAFLRWL